MYDVNADNTNKILSFCRENRIDVVGIIPFSSEVTQAMVNGKTIVEYSPESSVTEEIRSMWKKMRLSLGSES
jgi:MinD superfamily P-loop ATPase